MIGRTSCTDRAPARPESPARAPSFPNLFIQSPKDWGDSCLLLLIRTSLALDTSPSFLPSTWADRLIKGGPADDFKAFVARTPPPPPSA